MKLTELTRKKDFIKLVELSPPRGNNTKELCRNVKYLKKFVDFFAITHNPGGKPRMDSHHAAGVIMKKIGVETVCHFRIRDSNRTDLYGKLMAATDSGIENLLIIEGDVFPYFYKVEDYEESCHFIYDISRLNNGEPTNYMETAFKENEIKKTDFKTDFCIGAAGHPLVKIDLNKPTDEARKELYSIMKKLYAGTEFLFTQIVYNKESYVTYRDAIYNSFNCDNSNLPIIPGILPLLSLKTINYLEKIIKEVNIPEDIKKKIRNSTNRINEGIKITKDIVNELKEVGAPGVNIFSRTKIENIYNILELLE